MQVKDIVEGGYYKSQKKVFHVLDIVHHDGKKQLPMVSYQTYDQYGRQIHETRHCFLGAFAEVMESRVQPRRA